MFTKVESTHFGQCGFNKLHIRILVFDTSMFGRFQFLGLKERVFVLKFVQPSIVMQSIIQRVRFIEECCKIQAEL